MAGGDWGDVTPLPVTAGSQRYRRPQPPRTHAWLRTMALLVAIVVPLGGAALVVARVMFVAGDVYQRDREAQSERHAADEAFRAGLNERLEGLRVGVIELKAEIREMRQEAAKGRRR